MGFCRRLAKKYIKSIKKEDRCLRVAFVGKRLKVKQNGWLYFISNHPFEFEKK